MFIWYIINENILILEHLCDKQRVKSLYVIKGKFKNNLISISKYKEILKKEGFVFVPYDGLEIIYYPTDKPFIEIKTGGTENFNGQCYLKIKVFKTLETLIIKFRIHKRYKRQNRKIGNMPIIGKIQIKECKRLEALEEGLE